jgi:hypothetical protein
VDRQKDTCSRDIRIKVADAIDVAVILSSGSEFAGQFNTNKVALLASDGSDEFDSAIHVARHVDHVAQGDRRVGHC